MSICATRPPDSADEGRAVIEANKRLVQRFVDEVFNAGDVARLDDLVSDDHVSHGPLGNYCGLESIRRDVHGVRTAFPDLRFEIVDLVAEEDRVARRFVATGTHLGAFLGVAPTGRRVSITGFAISRVVDGKLAETWIDVDVFGLLRQLGAVAETEGAANPQSHAIPKS
jgi:steroid delta-isomerase-like uncharacterized protein